MSLESEITALRTALEANTAALWGGKPAATASTDNGDNGDDSDKGGKGGKGGRGRGKGNKDTEDTGSKFTVEQVKAAAVKVKDELGTATAKKLIKKAGKADQLADIETENYGAFIKACEDALNADDGDGDADDNL